MHKVFDIIRFSLFFFVVLVIFVFQFKEFPFGPVLATSSQSPI